MLIVRLPNPGLSILMLGDETDPMNIINSITTKNRVSVLIAGLLVFFAWSLPSCLDKEGENAIVLLGQKNIPFNADTFLESAANRDVDVLHLFLSAGMDIDTRDKHHRTAVHHAAKARRLENLQYLISRGADVNFRDKEHETPLHIAVHQQDLELTRALLKAGCNVNAKNSRQLVPLWLAMNNKDSEMVRLIISAGADPDIRKWEKEGSFLYPLHAAARAGLKDVFRELVRSGADLEVRDSSCHTPLHVVVSINDLELTRFLIDSGADVNARDVKRETPIMYPAVDRNPDLFRLLYENGAEINIQHSDYLYDSLLMRAYREGKICLVNELLKTGVDLNRKNEWGDTILTLAISNGDADFVRELIASGAKVQEMRRFSLPSQPNAVEIVNMLIESGLSKDQMSDRLVNAIYINDIEVAKLLISHGADVNKRLNSTDPYPLITAAKKGNIQMVKLLLESGADPAARDTDGNSALSRAAAEGHIEVVKMLLDVYRPISLMHADPVFLNGVKSGSLQMVNLLIDAGFDVNQMSSYTTPLIEAVRNGNQGITARILSVHPDLEAASGEWTALLMAVAGKHTDITRLLIQAGADVNAAASGKTPLMIAAKQDELPLIKMLINAGADLDRQDAFGMSALLMVAANGQTKAVQLLLTAGVDFELYDNKGKTALMLAADACHAAVVKILIEAGANPEIKDTAGKTARDYAQRQKCEECLQLLQIKRPSTF